ncbi:hypothetical protein [Cryobacterium shii]|uniref:Glycogen debranching enzyme GlgX n=1 Tax=Cryobacterium shii TaxID=1259235 RepID=A0AAQ2C504_9MICO|nr:hypothetical protein [Cryobacterium shii]TFC44349.1 hypothetical protein E3O49_11910 [Cryobacterium shii]
MTPSLLATTLTRQDGDADVNDRHDLMHRNLMATMLFSAGLPMILGGDEPGRSQGDDNNDCCQDNEISWFDWDAVDHEMLAFTRDLLTLRQENPALRPNWFRQSPDAGTGDTVRVLQADAEKFSDADWDDVDAQAMAFILEHVGADAFASLLNAGPKEVEFTIPSSPNQEWELATSSDPGQRVSSSGSTLPVRDGSFTLLRSRAWRSGLTGGRVPRP